MKCVAYYRVSTRQQGDSGLGLEAQRSIVANYAKSVDGQIVAEFEEIESGRKNDRQQLRAALVSCKEHGATLVIAKMDRLSRNVLFTATLMESGVDFVACDLPTADKLTIHVMAALAEREADLISQRTKAALESLKARGVKLGSPKAAELAPQAGRQNAAKAESFNATVRPIAARKRQAGWTYEQIADFLTGRGILTRRGKAWSNVTVRRLLAA